MAAATIGNVRALTRMIFLVLSMPAPRPAGVTAPGTTLSAAISGGPGGRCATDRLHIRTPESDLVHPSLQSSFRPSQTPHRRTPVALARPSLTCPQRYPTPERIRLNRS